MLLPYLLRYLNKIRPVLVGRRNHDALWVGQRGNALGDSAALADRLAALESEKASLHVEIAPSPTRVLRLHPKLADLYAAKVAALEEALNDSSVRLEANDLLRTLIERVELRPGGQGKPVQAVLYGDLARVLAICEDGALQQKTSRGEAGGVLSTSVVAGTRSHLYRTCFPYAAQRG